MADQTFAVNCGFFDAVNQDRTYSADDMNRPYRRVIANGVFATPKGTPSTDLQVSAATGMNITCRAGEGLFADKWFQNPTAISITVPSNTAVNPRIDSVIVQVDTTLAGRVGNIVYRTGTPASSPVPPSINQTEGVVEYRLANIRVNSGVSAITQSVITDRRGSSDCPWVTSLIYQVDTSTLYDQWQAAYEEYFETEKAIWDAWYARLTEDLDVSMTLDRHVNTVTTTAQTTGYIPIGLAYNHNTDILEVYINGLRAVEGTHYVVVDDTTILVENQLQIGQTVTFVVMRSVISGSAANITVLLQELESQIAGIAGGTPTVVDAKADMTEHDKIYILSSDSKWYYYSATQEDFVIGGTYGGVPTDTTLTQEGMAADAKAVGDALAEKADADDVANLSLLTFEDVASRNIYDNSNPTILNGFLSASAMPSGQVKFVASNAAKCVVIPVEPLTQYTWSETSTYTRYSYGCYESIPSNDDVGVHRTAMESANVTQDGRHYLTFTTPADVNYLVIYYYNSSDGISEDTIRSTIMLSEGDTLYPYEPYGSEKVFKVIKDNIDSAGSAGQALIIGQDGESLEWGEASGSVELDATLTDPTKAAQAKATGDAIADLETQLSQVVLTQGVQDWLDDHPEAMIVIKQNGDAVDAPVLGEELLSATGWTTTGWTGDFSNGFTNTSGNTSPLSVDIPSLEEGALYQFTITTSDAATNGWSDFFVSLGGSDKFETYKGGGASVSYTYGLICGSGTTLAITPRNSYTGTITGLSLKKVSNAVGSHIDLYDTDGNLVCQMRTAKAGRNAIYQGENSGRYAFWGYGNASLGDNAMRDNTSGFWNTAVGHRALEANQNGSRNIAIGYIALLHNTGGDRNVAIGTFALEKNTTGHNNVAINADSLQDNTTGGNNVGIGVRAACGNTTGSGNIGIGANALAANKTGMNNVGIGSNALTNCTGSNNVAIGNGAGDVSGMSGSDNIVIGWNADVGTPSGSHQIVLGTASHTSVEIAGKTINFNQDGTVTWS